MNGWKKIYMSKNESTYPINIKNLSLSEISKGIRKQILEIIYIANGGHIGGCFSVTDILVTLYFSIINHDPSNPNWEDRDFVILSKGHCCLALYTVLNQSGYFDKSLLDTYSKNGGKLGGHPKKNDAPGIEATTGSLGHGLGIGNGIALAMKLKKKLNKIFVVMSDGELNEGSVWESIMFAAQNKLDNLVVVVDNNNQISLDKLDNILSIEPLDKRFKSFNWSVIRLNGHDFVELEKGLNQIPLEVGKPLVIIADTIKGKGVSFMEGITKWHYRAPDDNEYEKAKKELS